MQTPVDLTWNQEEEADYVMEHAHHRELAQVGLMEYQRMHMRFSKQMYHALRFHEKPAEENGPSAEEHGPALKTGVI